MKNIYIVTGADGFLGNNIIRQLNEKDPGCDIRALILKGDRTESLFEVPCTHYYGNVLDRDSLKDIFDVPSDANVYVIHCAGIVDIRSAYNPNVFNVNVYGTINIGLETEKIGARLVYISSVHATHPAPDHELMHETENFSPNLVDGLYAKTKAAASAWIEKEVHAGRLDAVIIQPGGLIGPNDHDDTHLTHYIAEVCNEKLPATISEGYNFVDVRDVADGIIAACTKGRKGQAYFLTNRFCSMLDIANMASAANHSRRVQLVVPIWMARAAVPFASLYYDMSHNVPLFTDYALETVLANSNFSNAKARRDLGFAPRPMEVTVADTVAYLKSIFQID